MKRILMPVFLLMILFNSYGQTDSTSIYSQSLFYYNAYLDSLHSEILEIFVESNIGITDNFPTKIGTRKVTIVTWNNQKEIYKKSSNRIIHLKVVPAKIVANIIEICYVPYEGEYKGRRKGYILSLSDYVIFQFKFDCEYNTFRYIKTETRGI